MRTKSEVRKSAQTYVYAFEPQSLLLGPSRGVKHPRTGFEGLMECFFGGPLLSCQEPY